MPASTATHTFLGDPSRWDRASLTLSDVQGLWGGRVIRISGAGQGVVRIVERGMLERRYEFSVPLAQWNDLLRVVVKNDFLTIAPTDRPGIPDEARPAITLTNPMGNTHRVSKWAGVADERFDVIYSALVEFEPRTASMQPVFTGPYSP